MAAGTGSLFGNRRLVVVRRYDGMAAASQERLLPVLTDLPAGVCVVLTAKALDKRLKATKALLSAARASGSFPCPAPHSCPAGSPTAAGGRWACASGAAVQTLIELVGTNPLALHTELEKLALYAGGEPVTPAAVQDAASVAIPHAAELAVFHMAEAVADGKTRKRWPMFARLVVRR